MTIKQYLQQKLTAFGSLTEADCADIAAEGLDINSEYSYDKEREVGVSLCNIIEERLLAPRLSNVSENGFSASWNFDSLGKYYLWLCDKYGKTPSESIVAMIGVSLIRDMSNIW